MGSRLKVGAVVSCLLVIGGVSLASAGSRAASPTQALIAAADYHDALGSLHDSLIDDGRSTETLHLVGREVDSAFLDLGDADFSVGDQFAFTNNLLRNGEKVGEDGGLCVVTRITAAGASTFKCIGSNTLPGGQITVQGLVTYGPDEEVKGDPYLFAITGGTGQYREARGEVKIEEQGGGKLRLTFRIIG